MTDLKGLVKPLEWRGDDNYMRAEGVCGSYGINVWKSHATGAVTRIEMDGQNYVSVRRAKAAAQADYEARILAALNLAKVEALVGAAEMMVKAYREESDQTITAFYALEDALAAMKGGDT
jgi:hypothetical protein